jgi:Zn-dependent alcohol dehydrogenase
MRARTTKAAILAQSRAPLIVDEIRRPTRSRPVAELQVLHTSRSAARRSTRSTPRRARTGLPHLLGHEASAIVREIGPA